MTTSDPSDGGGDAPVARREQPIAVPNLLRSLAPGERPQERLEKHGVGCLSDADLLALLLRSGTKGHDVLSIANALLGRADSLGKLVQWQAEDFRKLKGIGRVKALQLVVVMELIARVLKEEKHGTPEPMMETPWEVADYLSPLIRGLMVEKFWVFCLNRKNRLLKLVEVSSGTAHNSLAHPREVFREAIRVGASAVICAHNHPSGDPAPSNADVTITRRLREAAQAVEIELHDHVIIGHRETDPKHQGYYSFKAAGLL